MDIFLNILIYILIGIGVLITAMNLPGVWVVFAGILISAIKNGFVEITVPWIIFFVFLCIFASVVDNVAVLFGAKKFGASKWGIIGAIVGMLAGLIVGGVIGLILGPFIGAVAFEIIFAKKESDSAFKAGIGTIVGMLLSMFLKMAVAISMIVIWQILL